MSNQRFCKRCLTLEAGQQGIFENIQSYLQRLSEENKVPDAVYQRRLETCKACPWLLSGMCRQCGCYVELRAAVKARKCPDVPQRW